MRTFFMFPVVFLFAFGQASAATDFNQAKFWLGSQEVIVGKNWLGMAVKEKLDISKIANLKQIKSDCNGLINLECIEKYDFNYNYKNDNLACSSTMTYTKTRGKKDDNLKLIMADCNVN